MRDLLDAETRGRRQEARLGFFPVTSYVFVLGAGFSKAINSAMPVLEELGKEVVGRLGDDIPYVPPGLDPKDFENWLSYLAEDQPWLLPEEQFRKQKRVRTGFKRNIENHR